LRLVPKASSCFTWRVLVEFATTNEKHFARENNSRLVVKGGGHSYQGTSNAPNSLLIWTRRMHDITVQNDFVARGCKSTFAPQRAVTVGAGTIWLQAHDARRGLSPPDSPLHWLLPGSTLQRSLGRTSALLSRQQARNQHGLSWTGYLGIAKSLAAVPQLASAVFHRLHDRSSSSSITE
jgi:hypothetical protein